MRVLTVCFALSCVVACGKGAAPTAPSAIRSIDPTTFHVTGIVLEIGAGAVADVTVRAVSCSSPSYGAVFAQTLTDAAGTFTVTVTSGSQSAIGCVFLRIRKEGYVGTDASPHGSTEGLTISIQRLRQATGTVIEVDGGPVAGVKVTSSGPATFSDANGSFVQTGVGTFVDLDKSGYVYRNVAVPPGQDVDLGNVAIQRAVTVSSASSVASRISSADVDYELDFIEENAWCSPCKWIDLQTTEQDLDIHLQWSGAVPLQLWASDYRTIALTATAKPGDSSLTLSVPAAARFLLVGARRASNAPQMFQGPEEFELTTAVHR